MKSFFTTQQYDERTSITKQAKVLIDMFSRIITKISNVNVRQYMNHIIGAEFFQKHLEVARALFAAQRTNADWPQINICLLLFRWVLLYDFLYDSRLWSLSYSHNESEGDYSGDESTLMSLAA